MATGDWTNPVNSLSSAIVSRGVTAATKPPPGGGSFVFGFSAIVDNTPGVAALRSTIPSFNPLAVGGVIQGAMRRAPSFVDDGFAPVLFINLATDNVTALAYVLGLGDAEPSHIVLRKGALSVGAPDVAPGTSGVLRRSSASYSRGTWLYLRLLAEQQGNGDMLLTPQMSDLTQTPIGQPPNWQAIPGMAPFTDPAIGSLVGGYVGFGFRSEGISRRAAFFDQLEVYRQIP